MLDPESPDVQLAVFGREVELFLESRIGIYLTQCCQAEIETATESLKRIEATKTEEIMGLQARIWRAESVIGWLADAIRSGQQAQEIIQERQ